MKEIWKDIKGFEGIYQVSNLGRIKSLERYSIQNHLLPEKIKNTYDNGNGYLYIDLYDWNGKRHKYSMHRLVAIAFIENPNNLPQINHKDENTYNNFVDNLEWCTQKYNNNYGNHGAKASASKKGKHRGKESVNSKQIICITTGKIFDCIREAAEHYNLLNSRNAISGCCKGKHKYIGKLEDGTPLQWMYYDEYLKLNLDN